MYQSTFIFYLLNILNLNRNNTLKLLSKIPEGSPLFFHVYLTKLNKTENSLYERLSIYYGKYTDIKTKLQYYPPSYSRELLISLLLTNKIDLISEKELFSEAKPIFVELLPYNFNNFASQLYDTHFPIHDKYRYIFEYQVFINSMNTCLINCLLNSNKVIEHFLLLDPTTKCELTHSFSDLNAITEIIQKSLSSLVSNQRYLIDIILTIKSLVTHMDIDQLTTILISRKFISTEHNILFVYFVIHYFINKISTKEPLYEAIQIMIQGIIEDDKKLEILRNDNVNSALSTLLYNNCLE